MPEPEPGERLVVFCLEDGEEPPPQASAVPEGDSR